MNATPGKIAELPDSQELNENNCRELLDPLDPEETEAIAAPKTGGKYCIYTGEGRIVTMTIVREVTEAYLTEITVWEK